MAHEEQPAGEAPTQDVAVHVRDYEQFTKLLKWGAIICLIVAFIVLLILR
jgi:Bacterial aa3 type cytochrome c oxidase subunit IV